MRLSALALCFVACLVLTVSGCALSSKSGEVDAAPNASECASECSSAAKSDCSAMKTECSSTAKKSECCASKASPE